MERMESMEPISAYYTTAYPEIQPDSGYGSREATDGQAKTPPAPTYDEELVHKVWKWKNVPFISIYIFYLHSSAVCEETYCGVLRRAGAGLRSPWC